MIPHVYHIEYNFEIKRFMMCKHNKTCLLNTYIL